MRRSWNRTRGRAGIAADDWLLKIIATRNRFLLGIYRRPMKAIGYLGKIEKILGVAATRPPS